MGIFNKLSEWSAAKYEKKVAEMGAQGLCPDCLGKGFNIAENDYLFTTSYDCPHCNGTGAFSDWNEID